MTIAEERRAAAKREKSLLERNDALAAANETLREELVRLRRLVRDLEAESFLSAAQTEELTLS